MKLVKALLPKMMERNSGKIVNIGSDAGRVGSLGETVYAGAKGGLIAFTKSLAREMARYNINVNCVCPGPTETPLLFAVPEKHLEAFKRAIPVPPLRKASRSRRCNSVFRQLALGLHHRTSLERQRRFDNGWLISNHHCKERDEHEEGSDGKLQGRPFWLESFPARSPPLRSTVPSARIQ